MEYITEILEKAREVIMSLSEFAKTNSWNDLAKIGVYFLSLGVMLAIPVAIAVLLLA